MYEPQHALIKLRALALWAGWLFVKGIVSKIDPKKNQVYIEGEGDPLQYDVLSINVGSSAKLPPNEKIHQYAITTRPIRVLESKIYEFEKFFQPKQWKGKLVPKVVVVGGGAAGVELAFAIEKRYFQQYGQVQVHLVEGNSMILKEHGTSVARTALNALQQRKIKVYLNVRASDIELLQSPETHKFEEKILNLSDGTKLPFHLLIWAGGPAPNKLLANCGLELNSQGYIKIFPTLQTLSFSNIFATGDCASIVEHEYLAKSGVVAVSEGPILSENLEKFLNGDKNLIPYQVHFLKKNT